MIDIHRLSARFNVRKLDDSDADLVLQLCRENTQFYEYCNAQPTRGQIINDMQLLPSGVKPSNKYYLGFFEKENLIAVMDIVDGYPTPEYAFFGFFMMKKELQGRNLGSEIIQECAEYLKSIGHKTIRLGIDKDNPQSNHFWRKNGFAVVKEVIRDGWTVLVADKTL